MKDIKEIIIDVDLTLCKSDLSWLGWLLNRYEFKDNSIALQFYKDRDMNCLDYNLSKYFDLEGDEPLMFWKRHNLYDYVDLLPQAKECIDHLYEKGFSIYFVSHSKTEHSKSKWKMLKRHFPWVEDNPRAAYIATKNKNAVKADIIIDDRHCFLNRHDAPIKIKMNTPYTQNEELTRPVFTVNSWDEIIKLLEV